jgi:hypothetical protein
LPIQGQQFTFLIMRAHAQVFPAMMSVNQFMRVEHQGRIELVSPSADRAVIAGLFGIPRDDLLGLQLDNGAIVAIMDEIGVGPAYLGLVVGQHVRCRLLAAVPPAPSCISWGNATKMELGGGHGGKSKKKLYFPCPGIQVASSAPAYSDKYKLRKLFQGAATSQDVDDYWLTESTGTQELRFSFEKPIALAKIRVCATIPNSQKCRSNYSIMVTDLTGQSDKVADRVKTARDSFGSFHEHSVQKEHVIEILFTLTRERDYGVCLKRIEIWSVHT